VHTDWFAGQSIGVRPFFYFQGKKKALMQQFFPSWNVPYLLPLILKDRFKSTDFVQKDRIVG
jgi:hypothetical protein